MQMYSNGTTRKNNPFEKVVCSDTSRRRGWGACRVADGGKKEAERGYPHMQDIWDEGRRKVPENW